MFRILTAIALVAALQGCATSNEVYLADGSKGYNIRCGGAVMNYGACLDKAGELCGPGGYLVVNQQGDAVPFSMASGGFSANPQSAVGSFHAQSGTIVTRNLFIKCGKNGTDSLGQAQNRAVTQAPTNADLNAAVDTAIAKIPELAYWRDHDVTRWNRAADLDIQLRQRPEYQNVPFEVRFKTIVQMIDDEDKQKNKVH
jgi:hypothetical protein